MAISGRVSLRRGAVQDRRRRAARACVSAGAASASISAREAGRSTRSSAKDAVDGLGPADRLRERGRQRLDHAPPLLRPVRHAGLQRGRAAPAPDHRARRNARRSEARPSPAGSSGPNRRRPGPASIPDLPQTEGQPAAPKAELLRADGESMLFMVIERFRDNDMAAGLRTPAQRPDVRCRTGSTMSTAGSRRTSPAAFS